MRVSRVATCAPRVSDSRQNRLLAALPEDVRARVFPHLQPVTLERGKVLYKAGETLSHVYFPADALVSLELTTQGGSLTETAMVGNEGVVGASVFMGGASEPSRAVVLCAGIVYRLPVKKALAEFDTHGKFLVLMLRYTQALITQLAQTSVCNRHHRIDQQLCRWLLMSLDRLPDNHLTLTQELIASMLGVRREGVTEAARKLQKLGVIQYSRGHITVLDRARLEQLSCECYAAIKKETDRLLP